MDALERLGPADVAAFGSRVAANIAAAVRVPEQVTRELLVVLIAGGHVLIEDFPGVGKTALARALAASIEAEVARVQCTADMLPADLVGANVFNQREGRFEFRPGPVFANLVLVDEINRASAKTQSGLLECMQEQRVTVDGTSHQLARPFLVLATQNPVELEGTYALPQAQLDRFMMRVSIGYPSADNEAAMLSEHATGDRVLELSAVSTIAEVVAAQEGAAHVHTGASLRRYIVAVLEQTRRDRRTELGASPRAGLMLLRAAAVEASLHGRDHVLPDDVQALAHAVLEHRLLLAPGVPEAARSEVVATALANVPAL